MEAVPEKSKKAMDKWRWAKENWGFREDGDLFTVGNSLLQPVSYEGRAAMLKIPLHGKEELGFRLLACWNGIAAVKVYRYDADAILMERAMGERSLKAMVLSGDEEEANRIVCGVVGQLHKSECGLLHGLVPLSEWFRPLESAAGCHGGWLVRCHEIAAKLLADPQDVVGLHGDIHYDNILDGGSRGWIVIDPKGIAGERGFDFANLFFNPDLSVAGAPGRLSKQAVLVAGAAGLEVKRLLGWIVAWAGLLGAWMLEDKEESVVPGLVAELALKELGI